MLSKRAFRQQETRILLSCRVNPFISLVLDYFSSVEQKYCRSALKWTRAFVLAHGDSCKVSIPDVPCVLRTAAEAIFHLEWKVEKDQKNDTHRHLSHLIGLYPGYALTNYDASIQGGLVSNGTQLNYTRSQVLDAAEISLIHRGDGTAADGDAGWEKVWRAACWAQLGNATAYYHQLTVGLAF